MKEQDQHIALCEWAGWKSLGINAERVEYWMPPEFSPAIGKLSWEEICKQRRFLPNTNSLDVLHEMILKLEDIQLITFLNLLASATGGEPIDGKFGSHRIGLMFKAKADQWRECLLKTLNLWREDSKEVGEMKGLCGFGRYEDDSEHIGCPYAKSDMTPCMARDGECALTNDQKCVGCSRKCIDTLVDIVAQISAMQPTQICR